MARQIRVSGELVAYRDVSRICRRRSPARPNRRSAVSRPHKRRAASRSTPLRWVDQMTGRASRSRATSASIPPPPVPDPRWASSSSSASITRWAHPDRRPVTAGAASSACAPGPSAFEPGRFLPRFFLRLDMICTLHVIAFHGPSRGASESADLEHLHEVEQRADLGPFRIRLLPRSAHADRSESASCVPPLGPDP